MQRKISNCHQITAIHPTLTDQDRYKQVECKKTKQNKNFYIFIIIFICYHGYHGHFKAKLLIVGPSEGRGFNFHTLTKKLVLDFQCSAPQQHAWRGTSVCERASVCVCVFVCGIACETVFCICGYDHQSVLETVSSYLS